MPPPTDAAAAGGGDAWTILPHVCRACLGRVLRGGDVVRCADCGARATGGHEALCGCGLRLAGQPAGTVGPFRCAPNPTRTLVCRAEIVVTFGHGATAPSGAR